MSWTVEQVLALAPDASSANSGRGLAAARKWETLGADATSAWGTFQGSGKQPYQTSIDLGGPAFKCSCPSRKFPCKHALGLFLVLVQQPGAMAEKAPPAWTAEWLAGRRGKEEKKAGNVPDADSPEDPQAGVEAAAAAARRAASREAKVTAGLEELGVWLYDLVRSGFAVLPGKPSRFWTTPAARLVDAQASGLARRVSRLDGVTTLGEHWPARLLWEAALLHLAREGWTRITALPKAAQADLRAAIGFTTSQEEVLAQDGLRDHWMVVAQVIEEDERLRTQRTWLFGANTRRPALCLSFSAGPAQPLDVSLTAGTTLDAELVFFPSAWPLRALVKHRHETRQPAACQWPHRTITEANDFAAEALTANPWIERLAFGFTAVVPVRRSEAWLIRDEAGHALVLDAPEEKAWRLCSLAGGRPVSLAGEWNGERFSPLGAWAEGRFLRL